jgi:alkaline phosphatase D
MDYPFTLGVAAGSPRPGGFVAWTRLAPNPDCYDPDTPGGMSGPDIPVLCIVATDYGMEQLVATVQTWAEADFAYSVHCVVDGLSSASTYYYQSTTEHTSPVGCAKTLPKHNQTLDHLKLAVTCCANYEFGYFSAYRHAAEEGPHFCLLLGDFIYDFIEKNNPIVRHHSEGREPKTLAQYRNRHAQYRTDPDLQKIMATCPVIVAWDDHDVDNNYANRWSVDFDSPTTFLARRAVAYQAFYEHMPMRPMGATPLGPAVRIYDKIAFGNLATIYLLDTRQYRSPPACNAPNRTSGSLVSAATCPSYADPARTMLGLEQEIWLDKAMSSENANWDVIAQSQMVARYLRGGRVSTDDWGGYPEARRRLLSGAAQRSQNLMVLGGDIHAFFANNLKVKPSIVTDPIVGTEFLCSAISAPLAKNYAEFRRENPTTKFHSADKHGYTIVDLTADEANITFRAISDARDQNATVSTLKEFKVLAGNPGVRTSQSTLEE